MINGSDDDPAGPVITLGVEDGETTGPVDIDDLEVENTNGSGILEQPGATATLSDDLLTGNESSSDGGAIDNNGALTVEDSTISGDSTSGTAGGGITVRGPGRLRR